MGQIKLKCQHLQHRLFKLLGVYLQTWVCTITLGLFWGSACVWQKSLHSLFTLYCFCYI